MRDLRIWCVNMRQYAHLMRISFVFLASDS